MPRITAVRRTLTLAALSAVTGLGAPACGSSRPATALPSPAPRDEKPHATVVRDGDVGTYISIPWGFSTSSYWLEGPDGLVAIDTQFLPSQTEEFIAKAEAMTGKKFVLAIVLHANPDKFNGTATFQKRGVKVITSAQVKAAMPAVHEKRLRAFYDRYQPDYPKVLPEPEAFGTKTTDVMGAGVPLRLHVLGAGCSEAHVVVEDRGRLFVGDLIANRNHSWLEIGKTDAWQRRLIELRALGPKAVYPGRGVPGDATLIDGEGAYLKKVIALVAAEKPILPAPDGALERVEKAIVAAYPDYGFPVFLKIGLPAEWERQARAAERAD